MSLYRNILIQAWEITKKNYYLWFFGIFAALIGSGGELLFNALSPESGQGMIDAIIRIENTGILSQGFFSNLASAYQNNSLSIVIIFLVSLVFLALFVFVVWLSVTSQAAIVNNVNLINSRKSHDFKVAITSGMKKFWTVFGLNFLAKFVSIIFYVLFVVMAFLLAPDFTSWVDVLSYVFGYVIFFVFSLAISFIIKYAISYSIIKEKGFLESLRLGWSLFKLNWLISLEMSALMFFLSLIVTFSYLVVAMAMAIPLVFLAILAGKLTMLGFVIILFLSGVVYLASLFLVGALLSTFQVSSWTLLFIQLSGKGAVSRIMRMIG